jgi:hypothetical protein
MKYGLQLAAILTQIWQIVIYIENVIIKSYWKEHVHSKYIFF